MADDYEELRAFLKALDSADVTVTDWEAQFIESCMDREWFSDKQREQVIRLIQKYGRRIGYT